MKRGWLVVGIFSLLIIGFVMGSTLKPDMSPGNERREQAPFEGVPLFECNNNLDDDGDGFIDFPADPDCINGGDDNEASKGPSCGNNVCEGGESENSCSEDCNLTPTQINPPSLNEFFGYSADKNGDRLLIGAPQTELNDFGGSASIFKLENGNWELESELIRSDEDSSDNYGISVSLLNDMALVGSYLDSPFGQSSGSAYVFRDNNGRWVEEQKIIPSVGASGDIFGNSVKIMDENTIIIGAPETDFEGLNSGRVYVFRYENGNWVEDQIIMPNDPTTGKRFGHSIDTDLDRFVAGAYFDTEAGFGSGAAYVFKESTGSFSQESKLLASDAGSLDFFGYSVAIDDTTIAIGANEDDIGGEIPDNPCSGGNCFNAGSVYIFDYTESNGWSFTQKLVDIEGGTQDKFGTSVSIKDDKLLIGANEDDVVGPESGSAFVFRRGNNGWEQSNKIASPIIQAGGDFGFAVDIDNEDFVVGAHTTFISPGDERGNVFIFN